MLTAKEIRDALCHDRATGQRPVGHFDHDAALSVGPIQARRNASPSFKSDSSTSECKISLVAYIDSNTGERLYKISTP